MQRHTVYGYEMVRGSVPAAAAQVVLNHHQRYDGSGYPAVIDPATGEALPPLAGRQIPIFSRIAMLADVYDAATTRPLLLAGQAAGPGPARDADRLPRVLRSGRGGRCSTRSCRRFPSARS